MNTLDISHARVRKVPTLDSLSESQITAIRQIPPHDQSVPPAIEASRPATIFTDPARFALEQQKVFRSLAVPVTLSVMLQPGSALAHEGYGVPLLLTRDKEGKVRAFLNACQHKGSKLVEHCDPARASRLTCPYHAWTFALDGRLIGVPREETFANLDKSTRGLAEMECREAGGIIWVALNRSIPGNFSGISPEIAGDFDAMGIPTAHVYGRKTFELKANWKLVQEPFLEGYHVQRLHARSIGDMYADTPNVVDQFGLNIRQISGKISYTPAALEDTSENIHKTVTHAYQLFPNCVVVTSPYYISVMFIMPRAADHTTVEYFMLTPGPAGTPKAEEVFARSYEMILNVFGNEDFRAAEISQVGLASGALRDVVYGGLESTIPIFYETFEHFLRD